MTPDVARGVLQERAIQRREHDGFPAAPFIAAFDEATDARARDELREALWTLLFSGDQQEQALASTFFAKTGLLPQQVDEAVLAYVSHSSSPSPALAALLAGQPLPSSARTALRAQFLRDPITHARFAFSSVVDPTNAQDWTALAQLAASTTDPAILAAVFDAAVSAERASDLAPVLAKKPEALLRAAAERTFTQEFLETAGL